jgi:hypothetical protein
MNIAATLASRVSSVEPGDGVELGLTGMGRFRVCDLVIESSVPLPELRQTAEGTPDCGFQVLPAGKSLDDEFDWFHHWSTHDNGVWLKFGSRGEDYLLRFPDQGDFLISHGGEEVRCCPLPSTPASTVRHLFLDQVIPLILSRREPLVLHASAVLTPQGAIAFVGKSGQGKSTLAACFAQIGWPLISDDYLVLRKMALRETDEDWAAIPSYPGVRLWPQASEGIFSSFPETTEIAHYTEKRRVSDPGLVPFAQKPSPLRGVYFLDGDGEVLESGPPIAPSDPREAFMKLVACAFNLDVRDRTLLRNQFDAIAQLRTKLPCFRLQYARDFSALPALRQLIVDQQIRNEAWT